MPRWLVGLRRSMVSTTALDRWTDDRGVTGVVWIPSAWVPQDAARAAINLVEAGAVPDRDLLWDLAVADVRRAARSLSYIHEETGGADGYVAVWMDPDTLTDPGRAAAAARRLIAEVRAPNVAAAFAWSGSRAGAVSAIVQAGLAVAVSAAEPDGVRTAWEKGMDRRRRDALDATEEDGQPPDVESVAVFLLGASSAPDGLHAVDLETEVGLVAPGHGPAPAVPLVVADEQGSWASAVASLAQRTRSPVASDDPGGFAADAAEIARDFEREDTLERLWARDHTVWADDPTEISDRLGWLDVPGQMLERTGELQEFARGLSIAQVLVCGMGGSSLAAEMFATTLKPPVPLTVLDTTHPDHVAQVVSGLDLTRTLIVVSSKSGTTVETLSHLDYLWSLNPDPSRYVVVTDPGSPLAATARDRGFARLFENPPDIGGRYSALSLFGLVPAVAAGVDIDGLLAGAASMLQVCGPSADPAVVPAGRLGATLAAAWDAERDNLTLVLPPEFSSFGDWAEQLVAESLGKAGTGILPVVGEDLGPPDVYDDDRLFVSYAFGDGAHPEELAALEEDGHPVIRISLPALTADVVGGECVRWEMAVALAASVIGVNPFDQPDVEAAKKRAREALKGGAVAPAAGSTIDLMAALDPADPREEVPAFLGIQAFVAPTEENRARLHAVRMRMRDRYRVATTVGFGPRFLHSTGQLHKGGLPGAFLQVTAPHGDLEIPGRPHGFGALLDAQADGDLAALREAGRPVARVTFTDLEALD